MSQGQFLCIQDMKALAQGLGRVDCGVSGLCVTANTSNSDEGTISEKFREDPTPEKENKGETTETLSLAIHAAFYCSLNQFSAFCVYDVRQTLLLTMGEDSICYFCGSSCA